MATASVIRGCGRRIAGGIYACTEFSPGGMPLEYFLYDPPVPIDPTAMGVTPVGVTLYPVGGVWHIIDWVGSEFYPNVADFLEETRRFGLSRRLNSKLDFSKLTAASRHLIVHAHAHIADWSQYMEVRTTDIRPWGGELTDDTDYRCPKQAVAVHPNVPSGPAADAETIARLHQGWPQSLDTGETLSATHASSHPCASLWWEDVTGGEGTGDVHDRLVCRVMPSFSYMAQARPPHITPSYQPGLVAQFPISRLTVIRNPHSADQQERAYAAASHAAIPISLEDE